MPIVVPHTSNFNFEEHHASDTIIVPAVPPVAGSQFTGTYVVAGVPSVWSSDFERSQNTAENNKK